LGCECRRVKGFAILQQGVIPPHAKGNDFTFAVGYRLCIAEAAHAGNAAFSVARQHYVGKALLGKVSQCDGIVHNQSAAPAKSLPSDHSAVEQGNEEF
jgi:hypothetical protein